MRILPKHPSRKSPRTLHLWHRRVGLATAFFVIFLVLTGMPLHHSDSLGLPKTPVESSWLLDGYGIKPPENYKAFVVDSRHLVQIEDGLYLEQHYLFASHSELMGAVRWRDLLVVVTRDSVILLQPDGQKIDEIAPFEDRQIKFNAMAIDGEQLLFGTDQGVYMTDSELSRFFEVQLLIAPQWISSVPLNEDLWQQLRQDYRSRALHWERVLLDFHSGRVFGSLGPWIMDVAGLMFLIMAFSGVWMWWRKKP